MNKSDTTSPFMTLPSVSHSDPSTRSPSLDVLSGGQRPQPAPRLIVLLPSSEPETSDLEKRIWEVARSMGLGVLLLSITNDFGEESHLRRKLITMAAMIREPLVPTDILIEHGSDWVKQVRKIVREGDVVACYADQKTRLMHRSLDEVIHSRLNVPVYILADTQSGKAPKPRLLSRALFWSGPLTIIGGFFWAEAKLIQLPQDWAHTALIYVAVLIEIILVAFWNSLFI
jgi:hypothetical protein